ncbi:hypothetical protein, partial [Staphylococcus aureus]|uniref:hypothetical protein n=1 Tax=Staphylococcus aureus TaxID=1280 RepID=UPI0039BE78B3
MSERSLGNLNPNGEWRAMNIRNGLGNVLGSLKDSLGLLVGVVERRPMYSDYQVNEMVKQATFTRSVEAAEANPDTSKNAYLKLFEEGTSERVAKVLVRLQAEHEAAWNSVPAMPTEGTGRTMHLMYTEISYA